MTRSTAPASRSSGSRGVRTSRSRAQRSTSPSAEEAMAPRVFVGQDTPLPSIEEPDSPQRSNGFSRSWGEFTFSASSAGVHTPSASSRRSTAQRSSAPAAGRNSESDADIEGRMANVRLSTADPLSMREMAAAVSQIDNSSGSQGSSLRPESQSARNSPSASRRRRSGSNIPRGRHEVQDEEVPNDPFNEPAFQAAFNNTKALTTNLRTSLETGRLHDEPDSVMQRLHKESKSLSEFKCPTTRTVGFVGDSGVGKSSLLNSLLDYKNLARTSNGGAACTCVVTEYHYHQYADSFVINIETFTLDEVAAQLTELLQSYRLFHLEGDSLDAEDKKDCEARALVALDTFRAMFRGHLNNEGMLISRSEDEVTDTLLSWLDETFPAGIQGRHEQRSAAACSNELMRLTTETATRNEPLLWPFIKKIQVYLNAHILSKGLILVDLPGLRDLNSARQNVTERYLLKCDQIFAICNIGRATTDVGVAAVFELAKRARLSRVGIICTKSDDIKAEEAKRDFPAKKEHIESLVKQKNDAENELREIEEILDNEEYADDDDEVQLRREQSNAHKTIRKLEFELRQFLTTTRNVKVSTDLAKTYKDKIPNSKLKVFCISNTDYWQHREEEKSLFQPYLQLSGIQDVRKHCIAIVGEAQLRAAKTYIKKMVPALLSDVELWVQSGAGNMSAERKARVRETLNIIDARMKNDLLQRASATNTLARTMKDEFREKVYDARRTTVWSSAAQAAFSEWDGWHHQTFAAFCRNSGDYSTNAVGYRNWNEEAMEGMSDDVLGSFQTVCNSAQAKQSKLEKTIDELFDWADEFLETEIADICPSSTTLTEALEARSLLMTNEIEDAYIRLQADFQLLRTDAFSGIRTSIFGQAMETSYSAARQESGTGSDRRRKALIRNGITPEQMFIDHMSEFRKRYKNLAEAFQEDIKNKVAAHVSVIQGTLDMIRNDNVALESERDPEFRDRVQDAVVVAKEKLQEIRTDRVLDD